VQRCTVLIIASPFHLRGDGTCWKTFSPAPAGLFLDSRFPACELSSCHVLVEFAYPIRQQALSGTRCASDRLSDALTIGRVTMIYRQIEYQLRAGLGRNEWVILIYYPDKADGKATVAKFSGTIEAANADARSKIDYWLKDQKRKALLPPRLARKPGRPRGLRT
jgi:hypothetical protein